MQITENTTPFLAERTVWADVEGRDWCVLVVKGTFSLGERGEVELASEQQPFVFTDEHHGDPGASSVRYECDFSPFKPEVDVLFNGHAYAPGGRPSEQCYARLQVGSLTKTLQVSGSRYWTQGLVRLTPSSPKPFTRVPLLYERAFGGTDHSHKDPTHHGTDLRNPIGTGFRKNPSTSAVLGSFLPQVEYPDDLHTRWNGTTRPAGLGVIGRGWQPRLQYAGTFDERWRNERAPFLPKDFDPLHFQAAPADQRLKAVEGGEAVQCINLSKAGVLRFVLPRVEVPVTFMLDNRPARASIANARHAFDRAGRTAAGAHLAGAHRARPQADAASRDQGGPPTPSSSPRWSWLEAVLQGTRRARALAQATGWQVTRLWISAGGMACPVGYSLRAACAAMRAGIARLEELPFLDNVGQPITGSWISVLPPVVPQHERLDALLCRAIEDCVRSAEVLKPEETPLLVITASHRRPGTARSQDIIGLLKMLEDQLGLRFARQGSAVLALDEAGSAVALSKCDELFRQRAASGVLVCGVDSFINPRSLLWLEAAGRLKTERNPDGAIPGEAAACAWITAKQLSSQASKVLGWGLGEEKATVLNEEPFRADGLVSTTRQALERARLPLSAIDFRVSDVGGESYAFREQSLLVSRLLRERKERFPLWHPAEFIGATGAPSGIIQWLFASDAIRASSAPGVRTLCCSSTAWGERAAVVLEGTPAPLVEAEDVELAQRFAM